MGSKRTTIRANSGEDDSKVTLQTLCIKAKTVNITVDRLEAIIDFIDNSLFGHQAPEDDNSTVSCDEGLLIQISDRIGNADDRLQRLLERAHRIKEHVYDSRLEDDDEVEDEGEGPESYNEIRVRRDRLKAARSARAA
ncbi:MAG: hypothetical protein ACOH2M_18600 [Cypionkella sp.]